VSDVDKEQPAAIVQPSYSTIPDLHYAEIGDAVCVYNPHTLNTHILPDETAVLLRILGLSGPLTLVQAAQAFAQHFDTEGVSDFARLLHARIIELQALGLVEAHAAIACVPQA
jgi:PqqD family protein of HPr-rel-A system